MDQSNLLFEIILLLALAAGGLALFERLRLPAIAGFLVAGALAGPGALGLVPESERVRALAEIGVVFLLFEIGLELPLERLRQLWRSAAIAGGVQVALTAGVAALGAWGLGLPPASALILGGLIAMSSTALVMRLLSDQGQLDAPHGQLALSILIFQDLSIVPFLLAIPLLAGAESTSSSELGLAIVRMVLALGVVLLIVRVVVPRALRRMAELRSPDLFSLLALLIVLGSAFLAGELGLTLAVGAFLAGVTASASTYAHQLFAEVVPLRGVLLGIFFTAVGMLFDPRAAWELAPWVLAYLATAVLLKAALITGISTWLLGRGPRVGLLAGLALAQTGEFSFVLAEAANQANLLPDWLHQVVITGSVLSLIATPFLIRSAPGLADRLAHFVDRNAPESTATIADPEANRRAVLIGFGPAGQTLARLLRSLEIPYVVMEANALGVEEARARGESVVYGDATRPPMLERLGVGDAALVAVAISDPLATRQIVSRIRAISPDVPILARTRYMAEVDPLDIAGATTVVAEEFEGSIELVARALDIFEVPASAVRNFTDALREEGYGAIRGPAGQPMDPWLIELLEEVGTEWIGIPESFSGEMSLADLGVRARTGASVMAVERHGISTANPDPSYALRAGDRLLVLGEAPAIAALGQLLRRNPLDES